MDEKPKAESKISNTEWGLVIGALGVIDLIQFALDFIGVGELVNWLVDIGVLACWTFYLEFRVNALRDVWQIWGLIVSFIGDEVTLGAAPMWFLDGIYAMARSKKSAILSQIPGGAAIDSATDILPK